MAENNIPYKVRAALLLVPPNTPMPTGAVTQSLWYIAVRSGDVHRVQHYLRTERDTEDGAVIGTSAVNGRHPAADRRGIFAILQGWLYTGLLWAGAFGCLMAALNFRDSKNDGG